MKFQRWALPMVVAAAMATTCTSAATLPSERRLAGVTVGSKGIVVLRAYGNPSIVTPGLGGNDGSATNSVTTTGPTANPYGNPYAPGPGGLPPGMAPPGYGPQGSPPGYGPQGGSYRPPTPTSSPNPYGPPGALPPAGADAVTGMETTADGSGLTTWTYNKLKGGPKVEFRLDEDGVIVEIVATGYSPHPLARTARGINLGDAYGKVMRAYGFPDETSQQGNVLTVRFNKNPNHHVAFQFHRLKLVRIAVARPKKATNITL